MKDENTYPAVITLLYEYDDALRNAVSTMHMLHSETHPKAFVACDHPMCAEYHRLHMELHPSLKPRRIRIVRAPSK